MSKEDFLEEENNSFEEENNSIKEENNSIKEEEAKKKYKRNKVKLTSAESAAEFIAKIIYDHQGDQDSIDYYRNLTYMTQTYISTMKLIREQSEMRFLIKDSIRVLYNTIRDNYFKMEKALRSVLTEDSFKKIDELFKKQEAEINSKVQTAEVSLYKMIEYKKSNTKSSLYGTVEWKTEIIGNMINELPLKYLEILMLSVADRHKILSKK